MTYSLPTSPVSSPTLPPDLLLPLLHLLTGTVVPAPLFIVVLFDSHVLSLSYAPGKSLPGLSGSVWIAFI